LIPLPSPTSPYCHEVVSCSSPDVAGVAALLIGTPTW
jgi:hypothetical protein